MSVSNSTRTQLEGMPTAVLRSETIAAMDKVRTDIAQNLGLLTLDQLEEVKEITQAMVGEEPDNG